MEDRRCKAELDLKEKKKKKKKKVRRAHLHDLKITSSGIHLLVVVTKQQKALNGAVHDGHRPRDLHLQREIDAHNGITSKSTHEAC